MASESNDLLTILVEFLSEMPTKPQQSVELVDEPRGDVEKLIIDYFPGQTQKMFSSYARMGRDFVGKNVVVIKDIRLNVGTNKTTGKNMLERAAVALLKNPDLNLDVVVIESIEQPEWNRRLTRGKNGRCRWLQTEMNPDNVYLTKEQVAKEFRALRSKRKKGRKVRKSRRKLF